MENKELIVVEQLPIIRERLEQLGTEIDEKVKNALSLVCTEETRKDVKEQRAELNKQFKELEEQRKAVKNAVLDPYNNFEEIYKKNVTDKFRLADNELKKKIDLVENELKEEKRKEAINYFDEFAKSLNIDFVKFEDMKELSISLTSTKTAIKKSIENYLNKINSDLETLSLQENKDEMLVEYKQNGYNLNNAIQTVITRIEKIEAEKKRQEQIQKQKELESQRIAEVEANLKQQSEQLKNDLNKFIPTEEPLQAPITEQENTTVTAENIAEETPKLFTMSFKVTGTLEQLKGIKKYLESEGIKYE